MKTKPNRASARTHPQIGVALLRLSVGGLRRWKLIFGVELWKGRLWLYAIQFNFLHMQVATSTYERLQVTTRVAPDGQILNQTRIQTTIQREIW